MSFFARLKGLFQRPSTANPNAAASKSPALLAIDRLKPVRMLEVGMGGGARARTMIEAAAAHHAAADIHYTGIGLFEADPDAPGMIVLREVHKALRATGAKIRLIPGQPLEAVVEWANSLGKFDMVVFASGADPQALPRVWFLLPRLLDDHCEVYIERTQEDGGTTFEIVPRTQIDALAASAMPRRKAA